MVDETGATLWSEKIENDESAILTTLGEILDLVEEVHRAVDIPSRPSAPLLALLAAHGQQPVYAGHLASAAGLVPAPRDSGRRTVNLHRLKRYSRRLHRVFYLSAQTSIIRDGPNRDYYLKKRNDGCKHVQAVIALARRRTGVLWALLRDDRAFTPTRPSRKRLDPARPTTPAAWLRPAGLQRDIRAPDRSACPPSWLTFVG